MSGQVVSVLPIPRETFRSARATFSHNNFYIQTGENLETILEDIKPKRLLEIGIILPQITLFQFLEGLTDAQAIDAARIRLDWKFALHLPFYSPIFRESDLCEFRQIVLTDAACQDEIERFVKCLIPFEHPQIDKLRNFDNFEMVKMVCSTNRLGLVHEAMSRTIEALVCKFPEWLRSVALPHWYGRYNHSIPSFNLPTTLEQQEISSREIIADIRYILDEVHRSGAEEIHELQEIKILDNMCVLQTKKINHSLLNDNSSNISICDFCVYKARIAR